jgi:hypothetical protein
MNDPRMQLGLALMASGRQGSASQALGQAGGQAVNAYQQAQHQQGLADYRNNLARMQQEQLQMQQQAAQAKAQQQAEYRARLQDPNFLNTLSPMAKQMAMLGVMPDDLIRAQSADALQAHRQAQLQQQQSQFDTRQANAGSSDGPSGPRSPAPRPYIDQPVGGGLMQRHKYDPQTGDYTPWGEPFSQFSPGRKAKSGADAIVDEVMGAEAAAVPDASALPGTGNLQSYMPKPQQPVGVMAAAGGNAQSAAQAKPAMRVPSIRKAEGNADLAAAKGAVAAGKSRQAVVNRLMQAGYTAEQIQAAGI